MLADSKPAPATLGAVDVVLPDPPRAVRRGRHRPGAARARRRPVRRRRSRGLRALHGQGSLQGGAARPRHLRSRATSTLRDGDEIENPFGYPVFVKPARLGSSVGISKAHDEAELEAAVALARRHDEKVLVEEFVAGTEVECGVLGNLRPAPIASSSARSSRTARVVRLRGQVRRGRLGHHRAGPDLGRDRARVQELAVDSFIATECEGMARVDFFVRETARSS